MRRLFKARWMVPGALILGYVLAGFLLVPWLVEDRLLDYLRAGRGLDAELGRVDFNPFLFRLRLRDFAVREAGGAPLAAFEELAVDFDPVWLVRGIWRVRSLSLVAPDLELRRGPAGAWNFMALLPPPSPPAEKDRDEGLPRIALGLVEIRAGRLQYADLGRAPAFRQQVAPIELRVEELSTLPATHGDYRIELGVADGGRLHLSGTVALAPLAADGRLEARLPLPPLAAYLAPAELRARLTAGVADLRGEWQVRAGAGAPELRLRGFGIRVEGAALTDAGGEPVLDLARMEVGGGALDWPQRRLTVDTLGVAGARLSTWLEPDAPFSLLNLLPAAEGSAAPANAAAAVAADPAPAAEAPAQPADVPDADAGGAAPEQEEGGGSAPPAAAALGGWEVALNALRLEDAEVAFTDRTLAEPATRRLEIEDFQAAEIRLAPAARFPVEGRVLVEGTGRIDVKGSAGLVPPAADLQLTIAGVELAPANPYVQRALRTAITEGRLEGTLALRYAGAGTPGLALAGALAVRDFSARDLVRDQPWLRWRALTAEDLRLTLGPDRLAIGRLHFDQPWADVTVHENGTTSIGRMRVAPPEPAAAPAAGGPSFPVAIDRFGVDGGGLEFRDFSLPLPFATRVHSLRGTLRHFANAPGARVELGLEGAIDRYGEAQIEARFQPGELRAATEFELHFDNVDFPSVTPYAAKFAGYAIESGRLDLDLNYRIEERLLRGENRILIRQLRLGERVEAPGAANLPLRLAVALLKDAEGNIDLDLPVRGDLGDPQVSVGGLVWKALTNVITKVATAPFAALGRLVGAAGEDLGRIGFDPGAAELRPSQREVADRLARALAGRPELGLGFGGCLVEPVDAEALRARQLEVELAARRETAPEEDTGAPVEPALRALFAETFSEADWAALAAAQAQDPAGLAAAARTRLAAAQQLAPDALQTLAAERRKTVLDYLQHGAGVDAGRLAALAARDGKFQDGRVHCGFELKVR